MSIEQQKSVDQPSCVSMNPMDQAMLQAARFESPNFIPMTFHINDACWHHFPQEALLELMASHPFLFPDFKTFDLPHKPVYASNSKVDEPFTDPWGCVWETTDNGIVGTVTQHPLGDWDMFENFIPPDPALGDGIGNYLESSIKGLKPGQLKRGGLRHGHTFLQLCDLRGYENLMFDMIDEEPRLWKLMGMMERYNQYLVDRDLAAGAQWMEYPEDLGMQIGPMLSPDHFRKYYQPVYKRLMAPAKNKGSVVHMHSDGDLRTMIDDIIDCGVDVLNLQDQVNGLDWIKQNVKGRIAMELDIDRQQVTVHGTPDKIDALIGKEVKMLGDKQGGLMLIYGFYPGTPLENAQAVADAMERYADYYSG